MKRFTLSQAAKASASIIALSGLLAADMAYAQAIDEIVVTARKKEETLLDAPLAISAFGEVELQEAGFVDIIDISKATPGLFIEEFNDTTARVNTTPRFRGVFLSTGNRLQQTATVFLDGIYMSGGIQTLGINELERVEVIKGPQSALFGRNTFAGAINYVTKDPGEEFRADIDVTAATRGEYRLSAGIEGPIAEGISYRIGGMFDTSDGHYDNVAVDGQRLGDEQQWSVNGTVLFEPTDNFRLKLRGSYREIDDGAPAAAATAGIAFHNFGGFAVNNGVTDLTDSVVPGGGGRTESVFRGTIPTPDASRIGQNSAFSDIEAFRAFQNDGRSDPSDAIFGFTYNPFNVDEYGLKLDSFRLSADGAYDFNDNVTFSFLAGYNEESFGRYSDFDLTPDNSFQSFSASEIQDFTIEGRLSGSLLDDRLDWTVGSSYVDIDIESLGGTANTFRFPIFFGDIFRSDPFRTGAKTWGIFGSLDYDLTDKFSVTLEGRYQEDEISDGDVNEGLATPISPAKITNFLPRITLRYEPTDNATLYANYSEGNLPGGFNPQVGELDAAQLSELRALAPGADVTFGEETLKNYEIGWKQSLADGQVGFNFAGFYMQRGDEIFRTIELVTDTSPGAPNPQRTVAFNENGATTDIWGLELDATANVNDNLSLQGSFAYIDAKIDSFPQGSGSGDFGDIFGDDANVEGQVAPRFPPISGSIGATWEQPFDGVSGFDTWYTRGDIFYTGNYWASNANVAEQDVTVDSNFRTGIRGENIGLEFFVTNLFDESAPAAAFNFADVSFDVRTRPGGFFDFSREGIQVALRDRRQFGVRANYTFR